MTHHIDQLSAERDRRKGSEKGSDTVFTVGAISGEVEIRFPRGVPEGALVVLTPDTARKWAANLLAMAAAAEFGCGAIKEGEEAEGTEG